jgi:hypothetical protein
MIGLVDGNRITEDGANFVPVRSFEQLLDGLIFCIKLYCESTFNG